MIEDRKIQGRVRSCSTCSAPIIFLRTRANKRIPVDAATVGDGDLLFDHEKHVTHFVTCQNSALHRKRK